MGCPPAGPCVPVRPDLGAVDRANPIQSRRRTIPPNRIVKRTLADDRRIAKTPDLLLECFETPDSSPTDFPAKFRKLAQPR